MKNVIALLALATVCSAGTAVALDDHHDDHGNHGRIKRVLLISIDGMHAVDFANCAKGISTVNSGAPYCPALAALGKTGVNYVAASTSKPSDSFPGLTAIITGGSPALTGVYYDVAYSRNYNAPAKTTGNGVAAGSCTPNTAPTGTTTEYEEGIDIDQTKLNGGAPGASLTDGGINSIDSTRLVRDPKNGCNPVFPWQFVRANSIFSVIHKNGGYAAWSDKHPAYSSVASGIGPSALDDFYAPEINSNVIALPAVQTPTGLSCSTIPDPGSDLTAWTNSFLNIECYDTLKVNAILNEIDGKDHLGQKKTRVPTIFGMNFQAVSVGQKLIEKSNNTKGGYLDAAGTPSEALLGDIKFVDASIAKFVDELKDKGLYDSTLIVITAKHGQSPIDPNRYVSNLINGSSPATLLSNAGFIPDSESTIGSGIGPTEDDVSLLWLKSSSDTLASVKILEDNAASIGLGQIYYGPTVTVNYNDPTVDPRTPDIIVTPNVGVTYSGSTAKQEEHGGFAHDDTNVMLLVVNAESQPQTIYAEVGTAQVAPTILKALDIDPSELDAVRAEGTGVLPDLNLW
ncbi:type I phosphodiesterase/nucleotide pyrophosphatase [Edaphobacter aggregans]|uniref:Type I phosphodiesterase/nucleotide pyrophosphatase n=1 Tax=Edaphobacter aggregans TaxID=570835 RepID=A0A428MER7_9BACT|nr:alkaline phosphatase family protein [Edaphobacter aggregans]RSL15344.1 type I phosphodiesterase/nucleotide pyrophosphatase [Edaphobacter aggregans]